MSRRPLVLLTLALACAAGAVVVWLAAFLPLGLRLDGSALRSFTGAVPLRLEPSINGVARLADPVPLALGTLVLAVLALLRGRPLMAAVVPAIIVAANATTQVLKPALADPRLIDVRGIDVIYGGSWPSGHSTAAMSLALCAVLVAGPRLRPLAALVGAGYAIAVGYALVVLGYHLPSDVFGGFLVAATFTLGGAAGLAALEARRPALAARRQTMPAALSLPVLAVAALALVAVAGAIAVVRSPELATSALRHPVAVATGAAIAALCLALTAGLAAALRR